MAFSAAGFARRCGRRRQTGWTAPPADGAGQQGSDSGRRFMAACPMALKDPSFTIGIEEEYLLVDAATRDLVREIPQELFQACEQALRGQVAREFLKSQIEVETRVHNSPRAAGAELRCLRATVAKLAAAHGLAP